MPQQPRNLGQAIALSVEVGCKAMPKTMGTNPTTTASSSPLPSPEHHHSAGDRNHPEQVKAQAGVIAGVEHPISRPFPRVHSRTYRNPPMVPKTKPLPVQHGGGFFQSVFTALGKSLPAHGAQIGGAYCRGWGDRPGGLVGGVNHGACPPSTTPALAPAPSPTVVGTIDPTAAANSCECPNPKQNPHRHRWPWGFCFGFQQNTPGAGQGWRC